MCSGVAKSGMLEIFRVFMAGLRALSLSASCSLYALQEGAELGDVLRFVASTPQSRAICNDPLILGLPYTQALTEACREVLKALRDKLPVELSEAQATVLNILRGGLNFGLREAAGQAFSWERHSTAFISAQRARQSERPEDWYITENSYQKVFLPSTVDLIFGDVVATGTSLEYALRQILEISQAQGSGIRYILFFTIGSERSEEILQSLCKTCREKFPNFKGATVVYLEGRFSVPDSKSKLQIKISGTDLLRTQAILAPEFIESQFESPSYPLERCTIYDAGSRAFFVREYLEDVLDYWEKTKALAQAGLSFTELLAERFPELPPQKFPPTDLKNLAEQQIKKLSQKL